MSGPERSCAVLFADVSGSTRLHELLGDRAAREAIGQILGLCEQHVLRHRGRVVKTIGDEIMAVLPDAESAALASCAMLQAISEQPTFQGARLNVHAGFQFGPVIEAEGDCFGDAVNVASRLTSMAKAGQILTSGACADVFPGPIAQHVRPLGSLPLRGKAREVEVVELLWRDDSESTMLTRFDGTTPARQQTLVLSLGRREWRLGQGSRRVSIGRDHVNDVVIDDRLASRAHGFFESRGGRFYYVDESLNGTFIAIGDDAEFPVNRDIVLLHDRGTLCFGHSHREPGERLQFRVE